MKFVLTADWHWPTKLGSLGGWGRVFDTGADIADNAAKVAATARGLNAPLIIAGDICDGPRLEPESVQRLMSIFRDDVMVFYVLGNHDAGRDWLGLLRPTHDKDYRSRNLGRRAAGWNRTGVYGEHYSPNFKPPYFVNTDDCSIGVYHQPWGDMLGKAQYRFSDLYPTTVAVCGDVHVPGLFRPPTGPKFVVSPGSLIPMRLGEEETGYGKYWTWDDETPDEAPVMHAIHGCPVYRRIQVGRNPLDAIEAAVAYGRLAKERWNAETRILFEAESFPPSFKAAVVRASGVKPVGFNGDSFASRGIEIDTTKFLYGFRTIAPGKPVEDITAVRKTSQNALTDAVREWPGLDPAARKMAVELSDPDTWESNLAAFRKQRK